MHTYHLIPNHCIVFLQKISRKQILNEVQPYYKKGHMLTLQLRSTKKLTLPSKSTTLPLGKTCANPTIRKHQEINPVTRKSNPTTMKNECQPYNQEAPKTLILPSRSPTLPSRSAKKINHM